MDSLIEVFHLDIKLLIAQAVNFAIVFFILYYFALKPLLGAMSERTRKIEKSLEDASAIEESLKKTEMACRAELDKAKEAAAVIMSKATGEAEQRRKRMIERAKEEIGEIINEEKAKMQKEKAQVLKEIKSEVAGLAVAAAEKILEKNLNAKDEEEFIKKKIK